MLKITRPRGCSSYPNSGTIPARSSFVIYRESDRLTDLAVAAVCSATPLGPLRGRYSTIPAAFRRGLRTLVPALPHALPHAPSPTKIAKCKSRSRAFAVRVHTRKSSEEGLNSLSTPGTATRASIAYIQNRKHEGWFGGEDCYDDGGFSEDTMDRSALKRSLLTSWPEIETIVRYEVM